MPSVSGRTLTLHNQKMVWIEGLGEKIQCANSDSLIFYLQEMISKRIIQEANFMQYRLIMKKPVVLITLILILLSVLNIKAYAQSKGKLYWNENRKIKRANPDGSNVQIVINKDIAGADIKFDTQKRKMYWVDRVEDKIYSGNLNGTNIKEILDGGELHAPHSITLDINAKQIYWGNDAPWKIKRIDFDGFNIQDIIIPRIPQGIFRVSVDAENIEIDQEMGKLYWADSLQDNIARADIDGSNYEVLINLPAPLGLALDLHNRMVYWSDGVLGKIQRSSLDGNNIETVLADLNFPSDIAIDEPSNKLYWVDSNPETEKSYILRANLDGSNVKTIYATTNTIWEVALYPEGFYDVIPRSNQLTTTWANVKTQ